MLQFKSIGTPLVLLLAVFTMTGCEQVEKSAQQVLDQAAQSAKQALDQTIVDTSKAAQQALNEALGTEGEGEKPSRKADDERETQEI